MATLQWASIERGRRRAGAPTRANHALPSPLFFPLPLKKQCASVERGRRRAGRGQRRIHTGIARRFCRAGAPTRANHALPSPLFFLLPLKKQCASVERGDSAAQVEVREGFTRGLHGDSAVRARPRAPTTHYLLPSSPFSLLILDYSTLLYVVRTVPWFFCRGDSLFSRVWRSAFLLLSVPDFLN